mmetsp:Transcript_90500/g.194147  ORF Transcript_90500/g.194147 Transcript_90500/m.194147 type:complete len:164 (+) Transcript_90500:87-578(+)
MVCCSNALGFLLGASLFLNTLAIESITEFKVFMSATSCKVKHQTLTQWHPGECKKIDGYVSAEIFESDWYYKAADHSCSNDTSVLANLTVPTLIQYTDENCTIATGNEFNTSECSDFLTTADEKVVERYQLGCWDGSTVGLSARFGLLLAAGAVLLAMAGGEH